jgi:hypothetical protein
MAQPLIAALGKLAVPKTATALMNFAGDMKETAENGQLSQTFKSLEAFGVSLEPLMAPIQTITSTIGAGTIEGVVKLMESMFKLMEQPSVSYLIEKMIEFFNNIIGGVDRLVLFVDTLMSFITKLSEENSTVGKVVGYLKTIIDYVVDFASYGPKMQEFVKVVGEFFKEKLGPMVDPTIELLKQVGTFLVDKFKATLSWIQTDLVPFWNTYIDPMLDGFMLGLETFVTFWAEKLEPIFTWFLEQLSKLETSFQNLTGIDVSAWMDSFKDTIKGWFD